jgi:succinate-semialdehyde dehydrogenase/glutarate-semialdehyde dehydrogenase
MITTINPATGEVLANYEELNLEQIEQKLELADKAFDSWKNTSFENRSILMKNLAQLLTDRKLIYSKLMSDEMGKPLKEAITELEKCIETAVIYANDIEKILANELYPTEGGEAYVEFDPIGIILAIMPWNFPFWQALRFAIPNILAGNTGLLKHASSVQGCAAAIEQLFLDAGFPEGVFQNLPINTDKVENIIRDPRVKAVTLTGSDAVGKKIASIAGSELKKTVLELGGSDPFIVLEDADINEAVAVGIRSRLRNAGQACTAAKRFILVREIADEFIEKFTEGFKQIKVGNPLDETTEMGPLSSEKALLGVIDQIQKSVELGAEIKFGGKRIGEQGFYLEPTILTNVKKGMPAYDEEIFGPVASIIVVENIEEAIRVANDHKFGLSSSLWTKDLHLAKKIIPQIEAGCVFVNKMSSSDPRMPFGGVKNSGYGRELSAYGVKEFLNVKSVVVR